MRQEKFMHNSRVNSIGTYIERDSINNRSKESYFYKSNKTSPLERSETSIINSAEVSHNTTKKMKFAQLSRKIGFGTTQKQSVMSYESTFNDMFGLRNRQNSE